MRTEDAPFMVYAYHFQIQITFLDWYMIQISNKSVYDTSALLEFLVGSDKGGTIKEIFLRENAENIIPTVVFAELISKLKSSGIELYKRLDKLQKNCLVMDLDINISKKAGDIHAVLKTKEPNISLIDCIIMAHADSEDVEVITTDKHYKNVRII